MLVWVILCQKNKKKIKKKKKDKKKIVLVSFFITRDGKILSMGLLVSRDMYECLHFTNFSFFDFFLIDDLNFGAKIRVRAQQAQI